MGYKILTRAPRVNVGDRVYKDRKWHSVTEVGELYQDFDAATIRININFGDGSYIPLANDDYIEVKRSSKATTKAHPRLPVVNENTVLDDDGEPYEDEDELDMSDEFDDDTDVTLN